VRQYDEIRGILIEKSSLIDFLYYLIYYMFIVRPQSNLTVIESKLKALICPRDPFASLCSIIF
jgi:hypothetical protein